MAIRITGMYSGLDTESIISELVSAQSVKKSKYVKDQTKLSWKMDAWKALNTKIYNFYTNTLDNMRFQATYLKKSAKVSNSGALSVVVNNNAVNGSQNVSVDRLAATGKLTGSDLSKGWPDGVTRNITGSSKLSDLGIDGRASFDVTVGGKKTTISVNGNMKISDVVDKLKSAGLNASFDDENHRFFISAKESGKAADFTITANNIEGMAALDNLGLLTKLSENKDDPIYQEYMKWAGYKTDSAAYQAVKDAEALKRAKSYKKANDELEAKNKTLQEEIDELKKKNEEYLKQLPESADEDETYAETLQKYAQSLYDALHGTLQDKKDENGEVVEDEDGNPVQERQNGLKQQLDAAKADLAALKKKLSDGVNDEGNSLTDDEKAQLEADIETAQADVDAKQEQYDYAAKRYAAVKSIADRQSQIEANEATIEANHTYYDSEIETDEEGNETEKFIGASDKMNQEVADEFDKKVELADQMINGEGYKAGRYADRIVGVNAMITVDGATFESSDNTFNINGMTITVYEKADNVTITTGNDVEGIYDMIKNFFTEYNKLINEMDALYNADSSKGYDPLTSEEKAEMADSEIEEWEKRIKDSLLRRDGTLGDITDAMKTVMMQGAKVNGKTMYLSDFGINTLGYFNAADNEKGAYHINGDADDASVKGEEDMLRKMLANDPDMVMEFFTGLSKNLYEKLSDKMTSIKDTSSAFTVYNDKLMEKEYKKYSEKITKEEDKLNALMDKWYEKFSRMETAMAKLQSKNNGLAGMLGGNQ